MVLQIRHSSHRIPIFKHITCYAVCAQTRLTVPVPRRYTGFLARIDPACGGPEGSSSSAETPGTLRPRESVGRDFTVKSGILCVRLKWRRISDVINGPIAYRHFKRLLKRTPLLVLVYLLTLGYPRYASHLQHCTCVTPVCHQLDKALSGPLLTLWASCSRFMQQGTR
jgi:hypothetical protein